MSKIRLFFVSDLHGSTLTYKKFLNAHKFYKVNVLVVGGDITGKLIIPIIEQSDGSYECSLHDINYRVKNKGELDSLISNIVVNGYYYYITSPIEFKELRNDPKRLDELFVKLMKERMENWMKLAEERLKGTGVRCYINPGNDDHIEVDGVIDASDYVIRPEGKVVSIDGRNLKMISTGLGNITPWNCPRDVDEETIARVIDKMVAVVNKLEGCIFNFHCPPHNTTLDVCPMLDKELRPIVKGGVQQMANVGSTAVRKAIEQYQPLLGLHGHIHESRGEFRIGRTLCLNPGSEYAEGILRGVILEFENGKIKRRQFTSG